VFVGGAASAPNRIDETEISRILAKVKDGETPRKHRTNFPCAASKYADIDEWAASTSLTYALQRAYAVRAQRMYASENAYIKARRADSPSAAKRIR
jgi:hypothetical protein